MHFAEIQKIPQWRFCIKPEIRPLHGVTIYYPFILFRLWCD